MTNDVHFLTKLRAYLRSYENAVGNSGINYGSLFRSVDTASDILGRAKTLSPRQFSLLESITRKFELYIDSAREFARQSRGELVQLYRDILVLFQGFDGEKNKDFNTRHRYHSARLNSLLKDPVIYPDFVEAPAIAFAALDRVGVNTAEVKARADALKNRYWEMFNRQKAERNSGMNAAVAVTGSSDRQ